MLSVAAHYQFTFLNVITLICTFSVFATWSWHKLWISPRLTKLNMWALVKHCQSISRIERSLDPLGSIRAAEVLWHQCDRINTSKAESGPTAASHRQYSTFHVLLRFTTISRKPTASQTEKDNGANLLLSGSPSASVKYVKFCVWWKIGSSTGSSQGTISDCVTWPGCKGAFKSDTEAEIIAASVHGFTFHDANIR